MYLLACRHNETTVELTGQSGHFWLDFEKESDAQEWWCSMQSLAIAKNRSSFTPYVASSASISGGETRLSRAETESSLGYQSMSKHAPVKLLPNSRASSTVPPNFTSGSPPPIKPSQSSTTLTSTGQFRHLTVNLPVQLKPHRPFAHGQHPRVTLQLRHRRRQHVPLHVREAISDGHDHGRGIRRRRPTMSCQRRNR